MPHIKFYYVCIFLSGIYFSAQAQVYDFDKEMFCTGLKDVVAAFAEGVDGMKGEFIGVDANGTQLWRPKVMLPYAVEGSYEHQSLIHELFQATFILSQEIPEGEAKILYNRVLKAMDKCFGTQYNAFEKITEEFDHAGKKYEQLETNFRYAGVGSSFAGKVPDIFVRSIARNTEAYTVFVDFILPVTER